MAFSRHWAKLLSVRHELSEENEAVLAYAIEMLIINLGNVLLTLILGWKLGVFYGTAACLCTVAAFRHTAGGAHSRSPLRCAAITVMVFPLIAFLAGRLAMTNIFAIDIVSIIAIFAGFLIVGLLAPVDTPEAPIISPLRRRRLKIMSVLLMVLFSFLILILWKSTWCYAVQIRGCLCLSILWVSFILSKPGHRFMQFVDSIKLPLERRHREV